MPYFLTKVLLSALLIAGISELSKRSAFAGAVLASLPLVSILAMIWIYIETQKTDSISVLSFDIFWLVLPSLIFFLALPLLLKYKVHFYVALGLAIFLMVLAYFLMIYGLKKLGIR